MTKLPHLVREAGIALEVYLAGRSSNAFNRAAFILADDCAELTGKLFLSAKPGWTDNRAKGGFKNFRDITDEVLASLTAARPADVPAATSLIAALLGRRDRRNGFFHSAHLLDLNLHARDCVEALTDMLDYGALLFPGDPAIPASGWADHVSGAGAMETAEALLRLDRRAYGEPGLMPKVTAILASERRVAKPTTKGCAVAVHPDDHHLRLAIRDGGNMLRDRLRALL